MEEFSFLKKLSQVKAPQNFEQKVLAELSLRKRQLKTKRLRLSLAGAFGAIVVLFVVINIFLIPVRSPVKIPGLKRLGSPIMAEQQVTSRSNELIPIIETVDYAGEIRSYSRDPSTIYILEQVSEETSTEINY